MPRAQTPAQPAAQPAPAPAPAAAQPAPAAQPAEAQAPAPAAAPAAAAAMRMRDLRFGYDIKQKDAPAGLSGEALDRWQYQQFIKDYLRCVKALDDNIGRVLDELANAQEALAAVITFRELEELFRARGVTVLEQPTVFSRVPMERRRHLSLAGGFPAPWLGPNGGKPPKVHRIRGLEGLKALLAGVIRPFSGMALARVRLMPVNTASLIGLAVSVALVPWVGLQAGLAAIMAAFGLGFGTSRVVSATLLLAAASILVKAGLAAKRAAQAARASADTGGNLPPTPAQPAQCVPVSAVPWPKVRLYTPTSRPH